ncbi:hypothetical protein D3C87_1917510 [compost metagenome]
MTELEGKLAVLEKFMRNDATVDMDAVLQKVYSVGQIEKQINAKDAEIHALREGLKLAITMLEGGPYSPSSAIEVLNLCKKIVQGEVKNG